MATILSNFQSELTDDTHMWPGGGSQFRSQSPNSEQADSYFLLCLFLHLNTPNIISEPSHNARTNVQCDLVTQHKRINTVPPHFLLPRLFSLSTFSSSPMALRLVYLLTVFLFLSSVVKSDGMFVVKFSFTCSP